MVVAKKLMIKKMFAFKVITLACTWYSISKNYWKTRFHIVVYCDCQPNLLRCTSVILWKRGLPNQSTFFIKSIWFKVVLYVYNSLFCEPCSDGNPKTFQEKTITFSNFLRQYFCVLLILLKIKCIGNDNFKRPQQNPSIVKYRKCTLN